MALWLFLVAITTTVEVSGDKTCAIIPDRFVEQTLAKYKTLEEAWKAFDAKGTGRLRKSDMRRIIAMVGLTLTDGERGGLRKRIAGGKNYISFSAFKHFFSGGEVEIPREDVRKKWPASVTKDMTTATGGPADHTTIDVETR
jgi:hypothetical protein